MKTFLNQPENWTNVAPAPKLSKAKQAAAAKLLAETNPNRARIEAKIAEIKSKLGK
jgi:hypothetical protein